MYGDIRRTEIIYQTAIFIALFAIGSYIVIPMVPVPVTLQTLFILLCGCVMKRHAAIPAVLYIILGTLGLPLFHQMTSGPGILMGPTGGYMFGFIIAALIVGIACERNSKTIKIAGLALGSAAITICGVIWISISTGLSIGDALLIGAAPFVIGDILKIAAAYLISERIKSADEEDSADESTNEGTD